MSGIGPIFNNFLISGRDMDASNTELPSTSGSKGARADVRIAAKGGAVQFLGYGINRGISLVFVAVMVRLLGPAGFGLYRQVAQILQMLGNLGPVGFESAALRSIVHARAIDDPGAVRGAARVALIGAGLVSSALFVAVFGLADLIAEAFADEPAQREQMSFLLRLGAAFVPLWAVQAVLRACTQAYQTLAPSVIVGNVVQPVALIVVAGLALFLGFGVEGAVAGLVLSVVFALAAAIWFFQRIRTPEERSARPRISIRPMVAFALPMAGVELFRVGGLGVGILVLGLLGSDREVGLFAVAASLQGVALIFPKAISGIWRSMVADLDRRGETERLAALYQTINRWVATFSFFLIAALIVRPEPFVQILGGREVADAASLTTILAVGTLFAIGTGPCAQLISMTGRPAMNLVNSVVGICIYAGLSWLFVPAYGAVGMAVVDSLVTTLLNVARVVEAKLLTGIQPFGASFLKPIVATLAAGAVLYGWRFLSTGSLPLELAGLAVAGIVYVAVFLIAGVDPEERYVYRRIKTRLLSSVGGGRSDQDDLEG
ncbi:MAG: polysaccharide biosynthesis protein [Gemmatimonadetes bacterium]|nr:polysaccharide biosynthesis protein [Gemmatimonadota bacterium]